MDTNRFGWYTIATKGSIKMKSDYTTVTEVSGDEVSQEQIQRLCNRYYWAEQYCAGKDVLEVACGSGQAFGLLQRVSKTFEAGDTSEELLAVAKRHYGERVTCRKSTHTRCPSEIVRRRSFYALKPSIILKTWPSSWASAGGFFDPVACC